MAITDEVLTVAQIRAAEEATMRAVPEEELMRRASLAVADATAALGAEHGIALPGLHVCVVAGSGHNGGDALLAGAELARRGAAQVVAVVLGERAYEPGVAAVTAVSGDDAVVRGNSRLAREYVAGADVVIDGFAGIGGRPGLPDDAWNLLGRASCWSLPIVAVDIPSGLAADSSEVPPRGPGDCAESPPRHVRAAVTVTFTARKRCLVEQPAAQAAGRVIVADAGIELPAQAVV
ncbi:NAD(P)H-hydrate epimerase [Demequina pelophila]|uniref:NAD(P)H-hydrate epimerase n=1 Tax=Demequina pelophila TaxID=1638984 RepID=UPI00078592EA|nr:NAD(P)H-hydrate epimerase [Demequina pelophila]